MRTDESQHLPAAGALVLAGEASLDATWPLTSPGVPSIRMLHNYFIVFPIGRLRARLIEAGHDGIATPSWPAEGSGLPG